MRRLFILLVVTLVGGSSLAQAQREKLPPRDLVQVEQKWPNAVRTSTGLYTEIMSEGTGAKPQRGDTVSVLYKGFLLNGTMFDSAEDPANLFTFQLARGRVIGGWEFGLLMMREGETRRLIVPFELGYGTRGRAPDIPRQATLIFEVELVKIEPRQ